MSQQRVSEKKAAMAQSADQVIRLVEERNAAVREYHMVMSERDSVHREMERLQESLAEATRRVQGLETEKKAALDEVARLSVQLKRDVSALQLEKERILQECYELRLKYNVSTKYSSKVSDESHPLQTPALATIRSSICRVSPAPGLRGWVFPSAGLSKSSSSHLPASSSCSSLSHAQARDVSLAALTQELEAIRLKVAQLERDLCESQNEAEMSKRRRDWAIVEKKKMALEREAMKQLCDCLRHERNQRDRQLSKALVENEELKRQLSDAIQALNDHHNDRLHADRCGLGPDSESPLSSSAACSADPLVLPTACSRDSAIYADLLDVEPEVFVEQTSKTRGSISAAGRQHTSPPLTQSRDTACITPHRMQIERPKPGEVRDIVIYNKSIEPLGIQIFWNKNNGSIFVQSVSENSIAAQAGIQVGDQLLDINGVNMRNMRCQATQKIASTVLCQTKKSEDDLKIRVQYLPDKFDDCAKLRDDAKSGFHSGLSSPLPAVGPSSWQARGGRRS